MKKSILLLMSFLCTNLLLAETTMCFKENHSSMATIENTKLDGGECKGLFSLNDMKNNNWKVEDIKITTKDNNYSFIYILKKLSDQTNITTSLSNEELEKNIIKRLKLKEEKEKEQKVILQKNKDREKGKTLYAKKCSSCHGKKGELKVGRSMPLNKISLENLKFMIARYTNDFDYGKGQQTLMRPYAVNTNNIELEKMYLYLQSLDLGK